MGRSRPPGAWSRKGRDSSMLSQARGSWPWTSSGCLEMGPWRRGAPPVRREGAIREENVERRIPDAEGRDLGRGASNRHRALRPRRGCAFPVPSPCPGPTGLVLAHHSGGLLLSASGGVRRGPHVIPSEVEGSRWGVGGAHRPAATAAGHRVRRRCRGSVCSLSNEIPRLRSATRHSARDDSRCPRTCQQGAARREGERTARGGEKSERV
jgi:hypothetical protein